MVAVGEREAAAAVACPTPCTLSPPPCGSAHKRAKEAAARVGAAGDPDGVAAGTYVQLQVGGGPGLWACMPCLSCWEVPAGLPAEAPELVAPV